MGTIVKITYLQDGNPKEYFYNGVGELSIGSNRASILVHPRCASRRQVCLSAEGSNYFVRACGQARSEIISKGNTTSLSKAATPLYSGDTLVCSPTVKFLMTFMTKSDPTPTASTPAAKSASSSASSSSTKPTTTTPASKAPPASQKQPPAAPTKPRSKSRYPDTFYSRPRPMKLPELIMHKSILKKLKYWPKKGKYNLAVLFHIPTSDDAGREKMEIDDITFCLAAMGFNRIEIIVEATYHKCKLVMDEKIAQIKRDNIKVHSLCVLIASHGDNSSASRLNILLHDGSTLDSSQLNRWAFDLHARHTLVIALTCHAENITHDSPWPGTTSGGFIWASSSAKTAAFKNFDITYSDGSEHYIKFDTFIRALYELLFCVEDLLELENNILMRGLCALWEAAHSIATGGKSSFGYQPCGNGNETPMRILSYLERLELLHRGIIVHVAHVDENDEVYWIARRVRGRPCGGRTHMTDTIQEQINARAPLEDIESENETDSDDERAEKRGTDILSNEEPTSLDVSLDEDPQPNTSSDHEDEPVSSPSESDAQRADIKSTEDDERAPSTTVTTTISASSAAIFKFTEIKINLSELSAEERRKEEQNIIRAYNAKEHSVCAKRRCKCGRRLVGYKHNPTQEERSRFSLMELATYYMPATRITTATACDSDCHSRKNH